MKTYSLPARELRVTHSADVVVCGGGTAGAFAAIAAAREGMSVLVVEQFGSLGGSATNALVTPVMSPHVPGEAMSSYLTEELRTRLLAENACSANGRVFDPQVLRIVLEQMATEAGVELLYYTFVSEVIVEDGTVRGVVGVSKSGSEIIEGKIILDCTGDGDISVLAGAQYTKGNPDTGKNQPISLRYIVGGIDIPALGEFFQSEVRRTGVNSACSYGGGIYGACCAEGQWTLNDLFLKAIAAGDLTVEDKAYWQMFDLPGRPGCLAFNNPEFFERVDGTNRDDLTQAQVDGKRAILRQMKFYKKYFKGFENAYVAEIASQVGIRESRNIVTDYVLTAGDLLCRRKFDDMFCQSCYPVDIHGRVLNFNKEKYQPIDDGKPWYEIPYRSLLVKGFSNLMVAGRCLGAEFLAQSSLRVQHSVRSSGEAAGIGAAMAVKAGVTPHEIDGKAVRARMQELGAHYA